MCIHDIWNVLCLCITLNVPSKMQIYYNIKINQNHALYVLVPGKRQREKERKGSMFSRIQFPSLNMIYDFVLMLSLHIYIIYGECWMERHNGSGDARRRLGSFALSFRQQQPEFGMRSGVCARAFTFCWALMRTFFIMPTKSCIYYTKARRTRHALQLSDRYCTHTQSIHNL